MSRSTLILSPGSYPWDISAEQTFLEPELPVLEREFERLILLPQKLKGNRAPSLGRYELELGYAEDADRESKLSLARRALTSKLLMSELRSRPFELRRHRALFALLAHAGMAEHASDWFRAFMSRKGLEPQHCAVVTFWWGPATTGFALAKKHLPGLRVFTRAHGFDLYEDRHAPAYIPCRDAGLRLLDGVFPDSDAGTHYLRARYSRLPSRCETARLGLPDPGFSCPQSMDGVLRVVSCSFQRPIKRLDLLLDALATAGRKASHQRIEWVHFGTGPLQAQLERLANERFPSNVSVRFAGYSTQRELFAWYREHPVDVFVNVSVSEGTAVAIMEAVACGIPILATRVGGNPEIATEGNGVLVSPNPSTEELAEALLRFASQEPEKRGWRAGSRAVWAERFNADRTFRDFARLLKGTP